MRILIKDYRKYWDEQELPINLYGPKIELAFENNEPIFYITELLANYRNNRYEEVEKRIPGLTYENYQLPDQIKIIEGLLKYIMTKQQDKYY